MAKKDNESGAEKPKRKYTRKAASAEQTEVKGTAPAVEEKAIPEESVVIVEGTSDTVCVALNSPQDRIYRIPIGTEPKDRSYHPIYIKGGSSKLRGVKTGVIPIGTYGYTTISRDDWNLIVRHYGNTESFKNGLIFACNTEAEAKKEAKGRRELRHGLEPIDPTKTKTKEYDGKLA